MTTEYITNGVLGIRGFLFSVEIADLRRLAHHLHWEPGRQGSGYEKSDLTASPMARAYRIAVVISRALRALGVPPDHGHDAWMLHYPDGAHVPPHRDPAPFGARHRRLNAILTAPDDGGRFEFLDGVWQTAGFGLEGDAIMFYPSEITHAVSRCIGPRFVFSVGVLV